MVMKTWNGEVPHNGRNVVPPRKVCYILNWMDKFLQETSVPAGLGRGT